MKLILVILISFFLTAKSFSKDNMREYFILLIDKYETCPENNFDCQIGALEEALEIISSKKNKKFFNNPKYAEIYTKFQFNVAVFSNIEAPLDYKKKAINYRKEIIKEGIDKYKNNNSTVESTNADDQIRYLVDATITNLGWMYYTDPNFYDFKKSFELLNDISKTSKFNQIRSIALNNLGVLYSEGIAIGYDEKKAFELFNQALVADFNNFNVGNLARYYIYSKQVEPNYFKSLEYFKKNFIYSGSENIVLLSILLDKKRTPTSQKELINWLIEYNERYDDYHSLLEISFIYQDIFHQGKKKKDLEKLISYKEWALSKMTQNNSDRVQTNSSLKHYKNLLKNF